MSHPTDRLRALFSGLPPAKRDQRPIAMLQVFIDDSKTQEDVLVLAGYIGHWQKWEQFTIAWQKLLDEYPKWDEFKMKRAIRHPERAQRFYKVVEDHVAAYVACVVEIEPLRRLCDEFALPRECRNPYMWALKALPGATYMELGRVGSKHPMEFIFDDRGEKKRVRDAWPYFCIGLPPHAQSLISGEARFEKSHEVLPLQSAEIIAWHTREHWLKYRRFDGPVELSWKQDDPMKGLLQHWDYDALKPNFESLRELLLRIGHPLPPLPGD